jgi:hypothetical protein
MKVGLWSDDHNFPNLVNMKLSAYHKANGDKVEWLNHMDHYDIVYCSKVFDFTQDAEDNAVIYADKVIRGGTGYHDYETVLTPEIEHICPDYSLYPQYDQAYCYLTRGCPRNCPFCIVSRKEGRKSIQTADLEEAWRGQHEIKLLDPNLLACKDHERILRQLAESNAWIDITQGFDIRFVTPDNMPLINALKIRSIHFAWDNPRDDLTEQFRLFTKNTSMSKHRKPSVYILTNYWSTHEEDIYRIYRLRELGYDPYVMIYNKSIAPAKTRLLQRWVNNKIIFKTIERFEDYNPKVG